MRVVTGACIQRLWLSIKRGRMMPVMMLVLAVPGVMLVHGRLVRDDQ